MGLTRAQFLVAAATCLPVACGRLKRTTIGVIPKATSHLFFVSIHRGVDAASKDAHVDVIWNGPREETEFGRQIEILDAMLVRHVDGLAISATDERALAVPVQKAIDTGIPVVVFDSGVNAKGYLSFVATDNYGAGCTAARTLAGLITGRDGTVGMVMHKPGGTSTVLREQGFETTMEREFPAVKIVARQYGMSDAARSLAATENILSAHPNLSGLFASSEASSIGAIQALQSRALAGKVRLVTFDSSKSHIDALRNGLIDVMLVQDAFRIGYEEAVHAVAQKLTGGSPPARLDLPVRAVARGDLDKPDIMRLLEGSA